MEQQDARGMYGLHTPGTPGSPACGNFSYGGLLMYVQVGGFWSLVFGKVVEAWFLLPDADLIKT